MKTYYSATEFNNKYWQSFQDKPFKDEWSRNLIKRLLGTLQLEGLINYNSIEDTEGNICYDLLVTNADGTKTAIEIKFRSQTSSTFQSHFINSDKFDRIQLRKERGEFDKAFLYTIWYDGAVWISNIFGQHTIETHLQNKTTNVSVITDGDKGDKEGHYYIPQQKFYFCYEVSDKTIALFFREPVKQESIDRKNAELNNAPSIITDPKMLF